MEVYDMGMGTVLCIDIMLVKLEEWSIYLIRNTKKIRNLLVIFIKISDYNSVCFAAYYRWQIKWMQPKKPSAACLVHYIGTISLIFYALKYDNMSK